MDSWAAANLRLRAARDTMDEAKRRETPESAPKTRVQVETGDCACAPDAVCARNAACPRIAPRTCS